MLLEIFVSGVRLDLFENTKIPIKLANPMFNSVGSKSFSFDIKDSETNLKVFNYENKLGRISKEPTELPFKLYFDNTFIFAGLIKSIRVETNITVFLKIKESAFYSKIRDKKIDKLADENYTLNKETCKTSIYDENSNFVLAPITNLTDTSNTSSVFNLPEVDNKVLYNNDYASEMYSYAYPIPLFKLTYLFTLISKEYSYMFNNAVFDKYPELKKLVMYQNVYWRNNHSTPFNYISDLPAYNIIDFINDFKIITNSTVFVDDISHKILILNNDDIISAMPTKDFSDKLNITTIERTEFEGFTLTMKNEGHDDTLKDIDDLVYIAGSGKTSKTSNAGQVVEDDNGDIFSVQFSFADPSEDPGPANYYFFNPSINMRMPIVDIKYDDTDKISPRFFFYRGKQEATSYSPGIIRDDQNVPINYADFPQFAKDFIDGFVEYPYLTQTVNGPNGVKLPDANIALDWNGINGLIENFYKKTLHWNEQRNVPIAGVGSFDKKDFKEIKFYEKFSIDNFNYLFDTLDFNLETNKISPIKFTAYRI